VWTLARDDLAARLSGDNVLVFGTWDSPFTDGATPIDVPTHLSCMYCHEPFVDGDDGAVQTNGWAQHKECALRSVMGGIGHHVNHERYCHGELGPDAGLRYRVSAILVWDWYHGVRVTETALEELRA
jgi:hypothetical protein